ncbi:MAG TPA: DNA cytosine methyltransferase [Pricia sp.]|nr:DNA cytosine methyltransferase [Pricia sp.]
MELISIDLFSGIGGLSHGLKNAGFTTTHAIELDKLASRVYKRNHKTTTVISEDIRKVNVQKIKEDIGDKPIHLLAGCPPCQGFSSIRRLNRPTPVEDERNSLIWEFVRFVKIFKPYTFMMENVPGLALDESFSEAIKELEEAGYFPPDWKVVNVKDYGVPQSRNRLVLVGSMLAPIKVAEATGVSKSVKKAIGRLKCPEESKDKVHKIFPKHTERIFQLIKDIPLDGGSRKDLGKKRQLKCHQNENVGFHDVYGRLSWDKPSTTITGGCLNPSKGRFLHPEQNRCISAREASMLQSFPRNYKLPHDIPKTKLALMIGNALPPAFSEAQSKHIKEHITKNLTA